MLKNQPLSLPGLLRTFFARIGFTWILTILETAILATVPLFIGFAIDGLLNKEMNSLINLGAILLSVIAVGIARRVYDTRTYGTIRVELGSELVGRSGKKSVSKTNARLEMGRELVDFLEDQVPNLMTSIIQLVVALVILFWFDPMLSFAALLASLLTITIYGLFHRRFFRLNAHYNQQAEQQVGILEAKSSSRLLNHLKFLRRIEVSLSDTEACVYGAIFVVLLGFVLFNLWYSATHLLATVGTLFAVVSYSWEFVAAALVLPESLQQWSRLSEITARINRKI